MAKAYYTCPVCGQEIMVTGCNRRDAESKAAWFAKQNRPCFECQRKAEQEAAEAQAAELGLPSLEGTPKQVKWAETIRADFLASEQAKENSAYADWLKKQTSAKIFIDNREDGLMRYWQAEILLDNAEAEQDEELKVTLLIEFEKAIGVFMPDGMRSRYDEVRRERDILAIAFEREAKSMADKYTLEELEAMHPHGTSSAHAKKRIARAIEIKKGIEAENPAEQTEEKTVDAPAVPVKEWRKFALNVQNILVDTGKACKIAFPHKSKLDGFVIWVPSSLVRGGSHSYENTVSMHKDMTFTAKKYGAGKWNKSKIIDEREVSQEEILEAFGGEVSGKFGPKQDVEEIIIHKPEPLAPVYTEAAQELVR